MSADRTHLLLVDPDEKARRLLELSLKKDGYRVTAVSGTVDALATLHQDPVSLVLTEVALGDGDGAALMEAMRGEDALAGLPVVLVTDTSDADAKARCIALGAAEIVMKPVRVKDVLGRVSALLKQAEEARMVSGTPVVSGDLADTTVIDLVNEFHTAGRSGALRIERGEMRGTIWFDAGAIVDAESVRDVGEAALGRMFAWDEGTYTVVTVDASDHERRITADYDALVEAAMGYAADWSDAVQSVGSLHAVYSVEYRSFVSQLGKLPEEANALIRTFDGIRTVEEAIAKSDVNDLQALQLIGPLVEAEVLQLVSSGATLSGREDGFEKLKTDAFKPLTRTAEQEAAAKRREQEEEERRRAEEERQRQLAELERIEAEEAELEASRRAEIEAAEAEAARLRAEADAAAEALREAAESRARALRDQKAELEERRFHLTGQLAAVPSKENAAPADVAAMRRKERAELERERAGTLALGSASVAAAAEAAPAPAPDRTVAFSPDVAVAAAAAAEAAAAEAVAEEVAPEPAAAPVSASISAPTDEIAAGFFDSTPDAFDDELFAEPSSRDDRTGMLAGAAFAFAALVLVMLWLSLGSGGEETEPVASEAAVEEAAEEAAEDEGSAPGPTPDEVAAAQLAAQQADVRDEAMNVAEDMAFFAEEVAEAVEVQDVEPVYTPPAVTASRAPAQPSRSRAEDDAPAAPRASAPDASGAEAAATACANAYNGGNYGDAISLCEAAARLNARDSNVYTYLGNAHFEVGNDSEAGSYLERAVQLNRRNSNALLTLGALKQANGDAVGAREVYETYLQFNPNSRRATEIRRILEQEL